MRNKQEYWSIYGRCGTVSLWRASGEINKCILAASRKNLSIFSIAKQEDSSSKKKSSIISIIFVSDEDHTDYAKILLFIVNGYGVTLSICPTGPTMHTFGSRNHLGFLSSFPVTIDGNEDIFERPVWFMRHPCCKGKGFSYPNSRSGSGGGRWG